MLDAEKQLIEGDIDIMQPKKCPICGAKAEVKMVPLRNSYFCICRCTNANCKSHSIRDKKYPRYKYDHTIAGAVVTWEEFVNKCKEEQGGKNE